MKRSRAESVAASADELQHGAWARGRASDTQQLRQLEDAGCGVWRQCTDQSVVMHNCPFLSPDSMPRLASPHAPDESDDDIGGDVDDDEASGSGCEDGIAR